MFEECSGDSQEGEYDVEREGVLGGLGAGQLNQVEGQD